MESSKIQPIAQFSLATFSTQNPSFSPNFSFGGVCDRRIGNRRRGCVKRLDFGGGCGRKLGITSGSLNSVLSVEREAKKSGGGGDKQEYDAIVIGSGIGGLVTATQLAVKGANVLVLEKYVIPGGSSGFYKRDGYTFDVGSSVMFGFGEKGNLNLITQAQAAVGCKMEVIPDPTTVHFHLPNNL